MNETALFIATLAGIGGLPFGSAIAAFLGISWGCFLRTQTKYWHYILAAQIILSVITADNAITTTTADPSYLIIDEFAAAGLLIIPSLRIVSIIAALSIFGFLDHFKILGIHALENLPGGIGIVMDDTAAALISIIMIFLANRIMEYMKVEKR